MHGPSGYESHARTLAQLLSDGVQRTKLGGKAERLLEVIADDPPVLGGSLPVEVSRKVAVRSCSPARVSFGRPLCGAAQEDVTEAVRLEPPQ